MGVPAERFRLDFFGGTMFWVRPEALRPLRELGLADTFLEEKGLLDGGLEHATERLFATSVVAAGYKLVNSDGPAATREVSPRRATRPPRFSPGDVPAGESPRHGVVSGSSTLFDGRPNDRFHRQRPDTF